RRLRRATLATPLSGRTTLPKLQQPIFSPIFRQPPRSNDTDLETSRVGWHPFLCERSSPLRRRRLLRRGREQFFVRCLHRFALLRDLHGEGELERLRRLALFVVAGLVGDFDRQLFLATGGIGGDFEDPQQVHLPRVDQERLFVFAASLLLTGREALA